MKGIKDRLLSSTILKVTASLCFIILLGLHYKLISDTYEVKRNELFRTEKGRIQVYYDKAIINDKLFPGGQKVIDTYLSFSQLAELEKVQLSSDEKYKAVSVEIYKDLIKSLQDKSNIDSLLTEIFKELNIQRKSVDYALVIHNLLLTFDGKEYFHLVNNEQGQFDTELIAGDNSIIRPANLVSTITVSTPVPHSYRIGFALYVEQEFSVWTTLVSILPILLLSTISILLMVCVYYFTFRNWIKQKKLNEIISDFVNSITHEYKTPISTIKVCVKNLRRGLEGKVDDASIINGLSIIERQSDRLNTLMDQVIHVSMFDPNGIEVTLRPIVEDLDTILHDLRLKYQPAQHVHIHFDLPTEELYVHYNSFLFTTAVINLVQNAVKYNNAEQMEVYVSLKAEGGTIALSVSDNGIGIANEELDYIFDRFYQSKASKNRGGIGLGLYYVKQLIVSQNWKITVTSKLNEGSTFTIFIPESTK